jgi:D-sedoheptulose 7-phosphate isomerase
MQILHGARPMKSPIPTSTNNIDRFFTLEPATFAAAYIKYLQSILGSLDTAEISRFIGTLLAARDRGATIFFIGNGGSAATASHFANDLAIGTNEYEKPFRAVSLTDNVPLITAIGNDFGYEEVFVRQLRILGKKGDLLIAISASGNSANLLRAFEYAQASGIKTIAITAFDGGKMKALADDGIHVPTGLKEYGPAEDTHMVLDHLVGAYLMRFVRVQK